MGQYADVASMPSVAQYKTDNPDWDYGDGFLIGTDSPYNLYLLLKADSAHPDDY